MIDYELVLIFHPTMLQSSFSTNSSINYSSWVATDLLLLLLLLLEEATLIGPSQFVLDH